MIAFTKTKLEYGWMSNMSDHRIIYGVEWRTAEHLFQAMRFSDYGIQDQIRDHDSPMAAKFFAKKNKDKMTVVPQSKEDIANMLLVLRLKITQWPDLKAQLLATGDEAIVEDVSSRPHGSCKFWGAAKILDKDGVIIGWDGQNMLGNLWIQVRSEERLK